MLCTCPSSPQNNLFEIRFEQTIKTGPALLCTEFSANRLPDNKNYELSNLKERPRYSYAFK